LRRAPASFLGILLIAGPLIPAENLLIIDVYARILPEGQIEAIPDPFLEAVLNGKQGPLPADVQQLQGKTFQIQSQSRDFEAVIPGADGQRLELVSFFAPRRRCQVLGRFM
jgi:hypothetical protein